MMNLCISLYETQWNRHRMRIGPPSFLLNPIHTLIDITSMMDPRVMSWFIENFEGMLLAPKEIQILPTNVILFLEHL